MFNNYVMYDEDIIESAEQVSAGEMVLSLEDLDFLLKKTVDLSTRQKPENKLISLHKALMRGSSEEAQYLIKKGADINVANEERVTPVQLAVENGLDELFPLLGL